MRWIRNRSNLYIVAAAPEPLGPVAATVNDASGRYLARSFSFRLPRDPAPANAAKPESLFQPIDVAMYPSPAAPQIAGWAVLRASVSDDQSSAPIEGALLRVVRPAQDPKDDQVLARGLSDARGEAFVPIPGIPFMTWSTDEKAVLADSVDLRIEAYADPAAAPPVDPDTLEKDRATLSFDRLASVPVKAGASFTASLRLRSPAPPPP